ncbi:MAG TPA: MBL fold metallo-hydrolase [Candidatus Eubacterium faecipullorum]|uniref:MBL fold metallo-hydrolase n=1 Tax=Candidatus Eubacterium faecipullorum TaxID=2838571 RepID=A0A9D1UFC7_9FIRM|nr:MBL fold metallo-hydrolase [Candidatus Eubacterium faecipullorum]
MKSFSESVKYIGVNDKELDLFESQYVVPNGVSYNSYVILDDKIAVMDTVDERKTDEWFANLEKELAGRTPDYLVISHLEPDHSANIKRFTEKYPGAALVASAKAFAMLPQFFDIEDSVEKISVKEGDTLSLGSHELTFIMAPMVHWPEVMVEYEKSEKILFSADGFGKFGALDVEEDWACEARRYYFNIVGKYGGPVQTLLKKAAALDIKTICPLHGPILTENLEYYIDLYNTWSSYQPEKDGVFIACASIYGNTKNAALKLKELLEAKGVQVAFSDITREDLAEAVEDAFKYSKTVFAASSYDGGVFPPMETLLCHLKAKAFQNRTVGIIENGSWAPCAARTMKAALEGMKNISVCENTVTVKSAFKESDIPALEALAQELAQA